MQPVRKKLPRAAVLAFAALIAAVISGCARHDASGVTLLNASYLRLMASFRRPVVTP